MQLILVECEKEVHWFWGPGALITALSTLTHGASQMHLLLVAPASFDINLAWSCMLMPSGAGDVKYCITTRTRWAVALSCFQRETGQREAGHWEVEQNRTLTAQVWNSASRNSLGLCCVRMNAGTSCFIKSFQWTLYTSSGDAFNSWWIPFLYSCKHQLRKDWKCHFRHL